MVIDLLPAFVIQVESIFGGRGIGRGREGDISRVHVSHDAAIREGGVEAKQADDTDPKGGSLDKKQSGLESGLAHHEGELQGSIRS